MKQMKHWQDPVNALLGVWLVLSPWILGFQGNLMATTNATVVGVLLVAAALGAIFLPRAWEEWTECVLGLWLAASPWALGFRTLEVARVDALATGAVVIILALWVLMTDKDYSGWLGKSAAQ